MPRIQTKQNNSGMDGAGYTANEINFTGFTMPENGWITGYGIFADAWGYSGTNKAGVRFSVGLYVAGQRRHAGARKTGDSLPVSGPTAQGEVLGTNKKRAQIGETVIYAVKMESDTNGYYVHWLNVTNYQDGVYSPLQATVGGQVINQTSWPATGLVDDPNKIGGWPPGYIDYDLNLPPLSGSWLSPSPADGATMGTGDFDLAGSMPHPASEAAVETTTSVQVQIYRTLNGAIYGDTQFTPTATEITNNKWQRNIDTLLNIPLIANATYGMRFRHADTFGVYGPWSADTTFVTIPAPAPPTLLEPATKIDQISGFNYSLRYNNDLVYDANAVEVEVYNSAGTTRLYNTTITGLSVPPNGTYTLPEWHADFSWSTGYSWRARFRDENNVWGDWSPLRALVTNSVPNIPTNLFPASSEFYTGLQFRGSIDDPNGDNIAAAEMEIIKVSDGTLVASAVQMTVDNTTKTATHNFDNSGGTLVNGTLYRWRMRGRDANFAAQGWGPWSSYAEFTRVVGATVDLLAPYPNRVNLVENPSALSQAEFSGAYWTDVNEVDGSEYVAAVPEEDAPGESGYVWEAHSAGGTPVVFAGQVHEVDTTRPYLLTAEFKNTSGIASGSHLRLRCYDASDVDLGTVYPDNIGDLGAMNGGNPTTFWSRYGGSIGVVGTTPLWPANTAKARIEIIGTSANGAVVRFDAVQFEKLPAIDSASEWNGAKALFGYGDGNTVIDPRRATGYSWAGNRANSPSVVVPILTDTQGYVAINYTHDVVKQSDRVRVEHWRNGIWRQTYDTGYVASTRTLIPINVNAFENEGRFRVSTWIKDANGIVVIVPPVEIDVRYEGPSELNVVSVVGNPSTGSIRLDFEASTLPINQFASIQIGREAPGEPFEVIAELRDSSATFFYYEAPTTGVNYKFKVRQVAVEGSTEVAGRWSSGSASVSYSPNFFIKDVNDPRSNGVGFRVLQADYAPDTTAAVETRHDIRGNKYPVFFIGEGRSWVKEITMYLNDGHGVAGSIEERWAKLIQMDEDRPTIILLDSYHKHKMIGQITGESTLDLGIGKTRRVTFTVEAVAFSEDIRDQQAVL